MLMIFEGTENPEITVETLNYFLENCDNEQTKKEIMDDIKRFSN